MRAKHTALILTAGFLLIPTLTWSQGPAGRPGGGQWGGGTGGGGMPGMGGGGMGKMDPDMLFNITSKGKDVIRVDELDPMAKSMFDRFASKLGLSGNEITREQFKTAMTKGRELAASGQLGPMSFQGGPGAIPGLSDADRRAEEIFKRMDKNEDGVLEYNEMPETLQQERDKYDTNHDGVIDLAEFKAYLAARRGDGSDPAAGPKAPGGDNPAADPGEERKRPTIIRAGNLPKDFPFADLDKDNDGQIGLYEWKDAGRPIAQFLAMDLNNDGFLTVDEYYRWKKRQDEVAAKANGQTGSQFARGGPGRGGPGGMNPGMMAMGDPGIMPGGNQPWGGAGMMNPGQWNNNGGQQWGNRGPGGGPGMTITMPAVDMTGFRTRGVPGGQDTSYAPPAGNGWNPGGPGSMSIRMPGGMGGSGTGMDAGTGFTGPGGPRGNRGPGGNGGSGYGPPGGAMMPPAVGVQDISGGPPRGPRGNRGPGGTGGGGGGGGGADNAAPGGGPGSRRGKGGPGGGG